MDHLYLMNPKSRETDNKIKSAKNVVSGEICGAGQGLFSILMHGGGVYLNVGNVLHLKLCVNLSRCAYGLVHLWQQHTN